MNRVASMARACAETKANKQRNIRTAVDQHDTFVYVNACFFRFVFECVGMLISANAEGQKSICRVIFTSRQRQAWDSCLDICMLTLCFCRKYCAVFFVLFFYSVDCQDYNELRCIVNHVLDSTWGSLSSSAHSSLQSSWSTVSATQYSLWQYIVSGCAQLKKKERKKKEISIMLALPQKVNKRLYESSRACSEWANVQMNKPPLLRGGFAHSRCPTQEKRDNIILFSSKLPSILYVNVFIKTSARMVRDVVICANV